MKGRRPFGAVLSLYPPWWRDRYGDEVRAVSSDAVAGGQSVLRVTAGLFVGAVRARVGGSGTPRESALWASRTRACIVVATVPALVVLPLVFLTFRLGQIDHVPVVPSEPLSSAGRVAYGACSIIVLAGLVAMGVLLQGYMTLVGAVRQRRRVGRRTRAVLVVALCAVVVVITVAAGAAVIFGVVSVGIMIWGSVAVARTARGDRGTRALRLIVPLPGVLAGLAVGGWIAAEVVGPHRFLLRNGVDVPLDGHPALAHALVVAAAATLGLGWLVTFVMLFVVGRAARLSVGELQLGRSVGVTLSVLLWVMASAAMISEIALGRQGSLRHSAYDIVTTSWGHWWLAGALGLIVASTVSTLGAVAAAQAWRVTARLEP